MADYFTQLIKQPSPGADLIQHSEHTEQNFIQSSVPE